MRSVLGKWVLSVLVLIIAWLGRTGDGRAQDGEWLVLPNSPLVTRFNDASFVNERVGWVVNGDGEIYRTTNRGSSWRLMLSSPATHFRSVGFVNDTLGFAGSVGLGEFGNTDPVVLRETRDGGLTWSAVDNFVGGDPLGLCGMQVVNDTTIVSVGRVRGPAWFIKSTDSGRTWETVNLDSLAAGLIDVRFFGPDTGYAVGLSNSDHDQSSGVILHTTDGGKSWVRRFATSRTGEWFWKVSFPSREVGYASLQRNSRSPIYFAKTTDGGETWEEKLFSRDYYFVQGIGFLTEDLGWIGGNSSFPTYETRDGGETWRSAGFGSRVNRFRFLGDSLAYAVGRRVYRYEAGSSVSSELSEFPDQIASAFGLSNYPNPFTAMTTVEFSLDQRETVSIVVTDILGRDVRSLVHDAVFQPGTYRLDWDGADEAGQSVANGTYILSARIGERLVSKPLLRVD